ncbi:S-layer homology domain-containing protein [Paenibacillus sp. YIM B09110]|uniref:S-layer homology domain-containing protein n=1 Tax=Paenibacillus sp. YIM B09110 TaxID=3126102 RepID=UPI00301D5E88
MQFRQKWIKLLCCALLLLPLLPGGVRAAGGSWADEAVTSWYDENYSTYSINSADMLAGVASLVNNGITDFSGKTLQISSSMSLAGNDWVPIGNAEHPFKGILIGQAGLNPALTGITVTGATYGGLLGSMSEATVGKFTISGTVKAESSAEAAAGAIVGYMDGNSTILDVTSTVAVQASGADPGIVYAGGIAGSASGLLSNVVNHGSVSLVGAGDAMAGGIAGATNGELQIKKAENTGTVSIADAVGRADAGGIIGLASEPLLMAEGQTAFRNSGDLFAENTGGGGIGGIVGRVAAEASVEFSDQTFHTGRISVSSPGADGSAAGGLVGFYEPVEGLAIEFAFVPSSAGISNIGGTGTYTGAIAGLVAGDFVWGEDISNSAQLSAGGMSEIYTGGIAGKVLGTATFLSAAKNSAAIGVEAYESGVYTGGLIGFAETRLVLASDDSAAYVNSGDITVIGTASDVYTGGIVSNINYSKSGPNVASLGNISVGGMERLYTGGFVGYASGADADITGESYSGNIEVDSGASSADSEVYTGGIAGYYDLGGTIESPIFTGKIDVSVVPGSGAQTGGIVGAISGGTIAGAVIGGTTDIPALIRSGGDAGGVAGTAEGSIENAVVRYADIETSSAGGSAGGVIGADRGSLILGPATIERISLNASADADGSSLGGLAGKISASVSLDANDRTVDLRHITGVSAAEDSSLGGAVGDSGANMSASYLRTISNISLEAQGDRSDVGGIAGRSSGSSVGLKADTVSITASGSDSRLGGLAGSLSGGAVWSGNGSDSNSTGLSIVAAEAADGTRIGGIAGGIYDSSSLQSIVADSPVLSAEGDASMAGGLVGEMVGGSIASSIVIGTLPDYAMLNVSGSGSRVGGLAGQTENAAITGSAPAASLEHVLVTSAETASGAYAGGIVGYNTDSAIKQVFGSVIKLNVKGSGSFAGGLTGYNRGVAGYEDEALAKVLRSNSIAGLTILMPATASSSTVGSLIGVNDRRTDEDFDKAAASAVSSIQSSKMTGSVTVHGASSVVGGLVGDNRSFIANNSVTEKTPLLASGNLVTIGGLAGQNSGMLYHMFSNAALTASGASSVIGGIAGDNAGTILSSYLEHDLMINSGGTAGSYAVIGGLAGRNSGTVEQSYTLSKVTSNGNYTYAGGLVGDHSGEIINAYAGMAVSASGTGSYSGGLAGRITGGTVSGSYSAGQSTGVLGAYAGGFAGKYENASKEIIDNSFYLKDEGLSLNSGVLDFGGGTYNELNNYARLRPILSSALANQETFPVISGWTFSEAAWRYGSAGGHYKYPQLNLNGAETEGPRTVSLEWYTRNPSALTFTIRTEEELAGLAAIVNGTAAGVGPFSFIGRTIQLQSSIDLKNSDWTPIAFDEQHPFEGVFNGNDYAISDYKVSGAVHAGLFGVIGSDGAVSGLVLAPIGISGQTTAGALAGLNLGRAEQVKASLAEGTIEGATAVGGLIGRNAGEVSGLSFSAGGNGKVRSSADQAYVGGLIGDNGSSLTGGAVTVTSGAIEAAGSGALVGGLTGRQNGDLTEATLVLQNGAVILATGTGSAAGGMAGSAESGLAEALNVSLTGGMIQATGADATAGGIFGRSAALQGIRNSEVSGDGKAAVISGISSAGGIVGTKVGGGDAAFDIEQADVRDLSIISSGAGAQLGGIAGFLSEAAVNDVSFNGSLMATGVSAHVGGIAGHAANVILYSVEAAPQISMTGGSETSTAGGIAGKLESSKRDVTLDFGYVVPLYPGVYEATVTAGSLSIGAIGQTADLYAGGIAGIMDGVSLYNSESNLSVAAAGGKTSFAGGAVGYAKDSRIVGISADGSIQAKESIHYNGGGLVGLASGGFIFYAKANTAGSQPVHIGDSVANGRSGVNSHVGGFIGQAEGTEIRYASSNRSVKVQNANLYSTVYAGGFAGLLGDTTSGIISEAYALGGVNASGAAGVYAGGFVGAANAYHIEQAYASGTVSNTAFDARGGGFAGMINYGTTIEDAYSDSQYVRVIGSNGATRSYAGGFAGYNDGSISRSYERVTEVSAQAGGSNSYMGSFIGYNYRDGKVQNSYYEGELVPIKHDTAGALQSANVTRVSFTADSKPEGWSFAGGNPVWFYAAGAQGHRSYAPKLLGLAEWRFSPDFGFVTKTVKGETAIEAGSAEKLAALALMIDDADGSLYKLFDPAGNGPLDIGSITLAADISLAGKPWLPIASFAQVLEGAGYMISGLTMDGTEIDGYGLVAENRGTIRNLKLADAAVFGGSGLGLIAGVNAPEGMISQVTVTDSLLFGLGDLVGGVVGRNSGTIESVAVKGATINGRNAVGGVAGSNTGAITDSFAKAAVKADYTEGAGAAGGIAGLHETGGRILRSFTYSEVAAEAADATAGGIAGFSRGAITDSYSSGTAEAKGLEFARAGGIAGYAAHGTLTTNLSGGQAEASVAGSLAKGKTFFGGVAGQLGDAAVLVNNYYDAQMLQQPIAYYLPIGTKLSGEAGKAEGKSTSELTGGVLPVGISASTWIAASGFYPQLASFSGSLDSQLSTVAVMLANGDTAYKVRGSYGKTPDASIGWSAEGTAPIVLTAVKNGASRTIAINKTAFRYAETATAPESSTERSFKDKTNVVLTTGETGGTIYYTVDGSEPSEASKLYTRSIELAASAVIKAITVVEGKNDSDLLVAEFTKTTITDGGTDGGDGGGGDIGGGDIGIDIQPDRIVDVMVNGKSQAIGQESSVTVRGRTTTTIAIREDLLAKLLNGLAGQVEVDIVFGTSADVYRAELSGQMIGQMADHGAFIRITAGAVSYRLAAKELQAQSAGASVVRLEVAAPASNAQGMRQLQQGAAEGHYNILAKATEFRALYMKDGKSVELSTLSGYAERTIELSEEAAKHAVAVMLASDGSLIPMPTRVVYADGVWKAVVKSLSGSGIIAVITGSSAGFADVQSHWAKQAIEDLAFRMIVSGTGAGRFEPGRSITRAEFAAIIVKALGLPQAVGSADVTFLDVDAKAWYSPYIKTVNAYGLVTGYPDGRFGANDTISRQQAMTILSRAMSLAGYKSEVTAAEADELLKSYADVDSIADYAKTGIAESIKAGLVSGRSRSEIAPAEPMTRAEVAVIVQKLLKLTELI